MHWKLPRTTAPLFPLHLEVVTNQNYSESLGSRLGEFDSDFWNRIGFVPMVRWARPGGQDSRKVENWETIKSEKSRKIDPEVIPRTLQ